MKLLALIALAVLFGVLSLIGGTVERAIRNQTLRRNDEALGRYVPERCPVPRRRACTRSACLHWDDGAGCRHPRGGAP